MDTAKFVDEAIREVARQAVLDVIQQHSGHGIDDGVRQVIRERAKEMLRDPEFDALIREQLVRWIKHA
jgi:hypothetical protein